MKKILYKQKFKLT